MIDEALLFVGKQFAGKETEVLILIGLAIVALLALNLLLKLFLFLLRLVTGKVSAKSVVVARAFDAEELDKPTREGV